MRTQSSYYHVLKRCCMDDKLTRKLILTWPCWIKYHPLCSLKHRLVGARALLIAIHKPPTVLHFAVLIGSLIRLTQIHCDGEMLSVSEPQRKSPVSAILVLIRTCSSTSSRYRFCLLTSASPLGNNRSHSHYCTK